MRKVVSLIAGIGTVVALGFAIPAAISHPTPSAGFVEGEQGACWSGWSAQFADYSKQGTATPELAIDAYFSRVGKPSAADQGVQKRDVTSDHVVFEKHSEGKVVEAFDVIQLGSGQWVVSDVKISNTCNKNH
jgi:hypothetical protein